MTDLFFLTEEGHIAWPPPYVIKKHPRAKHVKLRATPRIGLEVTIPPRFNLKNLPEILDTHKSWIIKQLKALHLKQQATLPSEIDLAALNEKWPIHYEPCARALTLIERPQRELVLLGEVKQEAQCKKILLRWLKAKAKYYLLTELNKISLETGLMYERFTMRDQRTRWGSCNHDKTISLNYKLIFLAPHLARHIIIHELSHTMHLNHSKRFWNLVAKHDAQWQANRLATRRADHRVPDWVL